MTLNRTPEGIRVTGWLATLGGQNVGGAAYESSIAALEVARSLGRDVGSNLPAGATYVDLTFPVEALLEHVGPEDLPR